MARHKMATKWRQIHGPQRFTGAPAHAVWLREAEAEALLRAEPSGNLLPQQASNFVNQVVDGIGHARAALDQLPVDVPGIYVLLPAVG